MIGRNLYRELERALGYRFRRRRWLEQALTHPSFAHEQGPPHPDNQRLEFLGDAALGLAAAAALYAMNPTANEGDLTKLRSLLSSTRALAERAQALDLGRHMRLGRGEDLGGGRARASILADTLEAVVGAAYMDGGMKAATRIFDRVFKPRLDEPGLSPRHDNPKGELQEWTQRNGASPPRYQLAGEEGPPHQRVFTVRVIVGGETMGEGRGPTKRDAQVNAAREALRQIG